MNKTLLWLEKRIIDLEKIHAGLNEERPRNLTRLIQIGAKLKAYKEVKDYVVGHGKIES